MKNKNVHDRQDDASARAGVPAAGLARLRGFLRTRRGLVACGTDFTVSLITAEGRLQYTGSNRWEQETCTSWRNIRAVACGPAYILGLDRSGCVKYAGRNVSDMEQEAAELFGVRLIACGEKHAAAVLRDGRVRCIGDRHGGRCATENWRGVADVCCGRHFTVGLTRDGSVLSTGCTRRMRRQLQTWHGVVCVCADPCGSDVYGLTEEGRLISTARLPASVRNWTNLSHLAVSGRGLWAVTVGGALLSRYPMPAGLNSQNPLWDAVAVAAGPCHAVTVDRSGNMELLGKAVRYGHVLNEVPAGRLELGRSDVSGAARLFHDFEAYCVEIEHENAAAAAAETRREEVSRRAANLSGSISCGDRITAGIDGRGHGWSTGGFEELHRWEDVTRVVCGTAHVLGLCRDGRVMSAGNPAGGCREVSGWRNIVDVQAAAYHSLGLTADGRVCFAGINDKGQGDVSDWSDIVLLRTSDTCTVGADAAGRLYITGDCTLTGRDLTSPVWQSLADIRVSGRLLAGLSRDGDVCVLPLHPDDPLADAFGAVDSWHGVTRIAVGAAHAAALCGGGTAVAAGDNTYGQCSVAGRPGAADVVCTDYATLILMEDGTVRCAGSLPDGARHSILPMDSGPELPSAAHWTDVIALAAGHSHAAALTNSGRVPSCGLDRDGQCSGTRGILIRADSARPGIRGAEPSDAADTLLPPLDTEGAETADDSAERGSMLWASYAPALRREAAAWRDHLSGSGDTLYILMPEGTYCYSFAENRMIGLDTGIIRTREVSDSGSGTLIVDEDGKLTVDGRTWTGLFCAETSGTHTAGLRTDGTVVCAGLNDRGQCDVGSWTDVVQILASEGDTLGLRADGHVLHTARRDRVLDGLRGVRAIAGWGGQRMFVMANGQLVLHTAGSEYPPRAVEGIRLFTPGVGHSILSRRGVYADCPAGARRFRRTVACGMTVSALVCPDGTVTVTDREQRETHCYAGWHQVTAAAASETTVIGVSGGRLVSAGDTELIQCTDKLNRSLFLLHGDTGERQSGAEQAGSGGNADKYIAVSCAAGHIAALRGDGRVFSQSVTGTPRATDGWRNVADVSCGPRHTAAVTEDGYCLAVGDNSCGQCSVDVSANPEWSDLVMAACGELHTAALRADGRVVAVGSNSRGQCRVDDLRDVISVTCLPEATVCVHADGRVTVRGGEDGLAAWAARQHEIIAADGDELRLTLLTVDNRLIVNDRTAGKKP